MKSPLLKWTQVLRVCPAIPQHRDTEPMQKGFSSFIEICVTLQINHVEKERQTAEETLNWIQQLWIFQQGKIRVLYKLLESLNHSAVTILSTCMIRISQHHICGASPAPWLTPRNLPTEDVPASGHAADASSLSASFHPSFLPSHPYPKICESRTTTTRTFCFLVHSLPPTCSNYFLIISEDHCMWNPGLHRLLTNPPCTVRNKIEVGGWLLMA